MASTSKVEKELQEATGVKPKAKEARQAYLTRLNGAVGELSDEDWKALSKPAGTWANAATKAFDADKPLPDFDEEAAEQPKGKAKAKPDDDGEGDPADDDTSSEGDEAEAEDPAEDEDKPVSTKKPAAKKADTKKTADKKPAAEAKPAKAAAKPKADKPKKARGAGGVHAVLEHVLKKPDDSVADIVAALKKDGITVTTSTVSSARGFFKLVARFLGSKKLLTKKLFEE